MISDIRKWYMRGLVALACGISGLHLAAGYFANIFFNAKGFIFWPVEWLANILGHINRAVFWDITNFILLILFLGPLILPRLFIWPALMLNLFILVGSADLLWHNYERAIIFWTKTEAGYGKYGWIMEQFAIMSIAALFLALLMPAALNMIKCADWYGRMKKAWKSR